MSIDSVMLNDRFLGYENMIEMFVIFLSKKAETIRPNLQAETNTHDADSFNVSHSTLEEASCRKESMCLFQVFNS